MLCIGTKALCLGGHLTTHSRLPCSVAVNAYGAFCRTAPSPRNLICATARRLTWTAGRRIKTTAGLSTQVALPSLTNLLYRRCSTDSSQKVVCSLLARLCLGGNVIAPDCFRPRTLPAAFVHISNATHTQQHNSLSHDTHLLCSLLHKKTLATHCKPHACITHSFTLVATSLPPIPDHSPTYSPMHSPHHLCTACFADFEEIPFCEIASPSRFPALYELNNALPLAQNQAPSDDSDDSGDASFGEEEDSFVAEEVEVPPGTEVSFLYTSQASGLPDTVMQGLLRQPNFSALLSTTSPDLQVCQCTRRSAALQLPHVSRLRPRTRLRAHIGDPVRGRTLD